MLARVRKSHNLRRVGQERLAGRTKAGRPLLAREPNRCSEPRVGCTLTA